MPKRVVAEIEINGFQGARDRVRMVVDDDSDDWYGNWEADDPEVEERFNRFYHPRKIGISHFPCEDAIYLAFEAMEEMEIFDPRWIQEVTRPPVPPPPDEGAIA